MSTIVVVLEFEVEKFTCILGTRVWLNVLSIVL